MLRVLGLGKFEFRVQAFGSWPEVPTVTRLWSAIL